MPTLLRIGSMMGPRGSSDNYVFGGQSAELVADHAGVRNEGVPFYRKGGAASTFSGLFGTRYDRSDLATMCDSSGNLVWNAHNLVDTPDAPVTQDVTVVSGAQYTVKMLGAGSVVLSNAGSGTATDGSGVTFTAASTTLTLTVSGSVDDMWAYRSDLGGMATVPVDARGNASESDYVSGGPRFLPRRENYRYNGSSWVLAGLLAEPATTNLLLNTNTLSTQSATVTAVSHTLHFTGTGTITLSGASTAGPLVGTGTGEENRVSLVFTPSAGSLTLTVTGTVTNAQLETGVQTSYIPSAGSQAIRAADVTTGQALAADMPNSTEALWFAMSGTMSYADNSNVNEAIFFRRIVDASNYVQMTLSTTAGDTGEPRATMRSTTDGIDNSVGATDVYSPGIDVEFSVAARFTDSVVQGAADGTAFTADTTPTVMPNVTGEDFDIGVTFTGNIELVMAGTGDPGEAGIEEASA